MRFRPFRWAALACLLATASLEAFAEPVSEAAVRELASTKIVELADFYRRLGTLAESDAVLKRIGFRATHDVALAGGIARELAWTLAFRRHANPTRLADVHLPDRDLDVIYLGNADGDDEAYVLNLVKSTLAETLAEHGATVMRVDAHALREKQEETRLGQQGYDTVSQALVTPAALLDLAELLKLADKNEAVPALLTPTIVYHLPKGPLDADADFLHQLVQVIRVMKIAAEFPEVPLSDETRTNLRTVLEAYRTRKKALETFLKDAADRNDHYFRNRLSDVYGALLRFQGGGALYKDLNTEFGLASFAPLRSVAAASAVTRRTVDVLSTDTPRTAERERILAPGDRYPMGDGFFFDPESRQVLHMGPDGEKQISLSFRVEGSQVTALAFSGATGTVEDELLPIDRWEILRVRRFRGSRWAVIARNRRTNYHTAGILDLSKGANAEIVFVNNRAFNRKSSDGAHKGKSGPMLSLFDITATRDGLVAFSQTRTFLKHELPGNSFVISPVPMQVPVRTPLAAFEIEDGVYYYLAMDGRLYALQESAAAELLLEDVLGIAKSEQGLLAYVEEPPAKTPALYVFERGAKGYRRLPFPMPAADATPLAIAGNDGATVLRRKAGDVTPAAVETPALAYLRRPESELLQELKALAPQLPAGTDLAVLFGQVTASDQAPMALTDDLRPESRRVGLITQFTKAVLAAKDDAATRAVLGRIFLLRSVLELRRGRSPLFGHSPNTWLLPQLFAKAAEFASKDTLPLLVELSLPETIDELLAREPSDSGAPNGALAPKFVPHVRQAAADHLGPLCSREIALSAESGT